jgi:hypothetical protein
LTFSPVVLGALSVMADNTLLPPRIKALAPAATPNFKNFLREGKLFFIPCQVYGWLTTIQTKTLKPYNQQLRHSSSRGKHYFYRVIKTTG